MPTQHVVHRCVSVHASVGAGGRMSSNIGGGRQSGGVFHFISIHVIVIWVLLFLKFLDEYTVMCFAWDKTLNRVLK